MQEPAKNEARLDRRGLLAALGSASAVAMGTHVHGRKKTREGETPAPREVLSRGDVILFQGDSITDDGRSRETADEPNIQTTLGNGYAWLAASGLLVAGSPGRLSIYNRGVSGDRVAHLAKRWEDDCLALQPDVLSILIGVNDAWHEALATGPGTAATYEEEYDALLTRTRETLPDVALVVCEPWVLKCGFVDDSWFPMFDGYRAAAKRLADKHGATWVPFQSMFDEALHYAPPEHWAADGVHPSSAGASLMAQTWLRAVSGR